LNSIPLEKINKKIKKAQKRWADGIINIGKYYFEKKDYIALTNNFIEELYSFKDNKVLFKPTKASKKQFRKNKNEFISYFIGHNKVSDEDKGFALEPYKSVQFINFDFSIFENIIISMGNYIFTNYEDEKIKVEYSFGYILDENEDELKIIFHHSSVPYNTE
jgi:hypothetical protein